MGRTTETTSLRTWGPPSVRCRCCTLSASDSIVLQLDDPARSAVAGDKMRRVQVSLAEGSWKPERFLKPSFSLNRVRVAVSLSDESPLVLSLQEQENIAQLQFADGARDASFRCRASVNDLMVWLQLLPLSVMSSLVIRSHNHKELHVCCRGAVITFWMSDRLKSLVRIPGKAGAQCRRAGGGWIVEANYASASLPTAGKLVLEIPSVLEYELTYSRPADYDLGNSLLSAAGFSDVEAVECLVSRAFVARNVLGCPAIADAVSNDPDDCLTWLSLLLAYSEAAAADVLAPENPPAIVAVSNMEAATRRANFLVVEMVGILVPPFVCDLLARLPRLLEEAGCSRGAASRPVTVVSVKRDLTHVDKIASDGFYSLSVVEADGWNVVYRSMTT